MSIPPQPNSQSQNSQMPPPPLPTRLSSQQQLQQQLQQARRPSTSPKTTLLQRISKNRKKKKPDPPSVILARYARFGVAPPPKLTNQLRFQLFLDRIQKRQWNFLSNMVNPFVVYNGVKLSLYELTLMIKNDADDDGESSKWLAAQKIVEMVGGRVFPNPPERDVKRFERDPLMGRVVARSLQGEERVRHLWVDFEDGKISGIWDIREEAPRRRRRDAKKPPRKAVALPGQGKRELERDRVQDLEEWYKSYIACINSGEEGMKEGLGRFVSPEKGVKRNGVALSLEKYRSLMVEAMDAVAGLKFEIRGVVVDDERQMVAARLEFVGTPTKVYMGALPTGEEVEWAEHVFYWLDGGKISDVLSLVDWESYREQLAL